MTKAEIIAAITARVDHVVAVTSVGSQGNVNVYDVAVLHTQENGTTAKSVQTVYVVDEGGGIGVEFAYFGLRKVANFGDASLDSAFIILLKTVIAAFQVANPNVKKVTIDQRNEVSKFAVLTIFTDDGVTVTSSRKYAYDDAGTIRVRDYIQA